MKRLREVAAGDTIPSLVNGAFDKVAEEIKDLRATERRTRDRMREIESDPEIVDNPEEEKADLEDTRRLLARLIVEQRSKYPLECADRRGRVAELRVS